MEKQDVVYGRVHGAGLLADIAYPQSEQPIPAIISVHGGRWRGGHKRDRSTIVVKQWAGYGLFSMSIDYRLVGCTPAPACYQDVQCAIRYVHAHAQQYNIEALAEIYAQAEGVLYAEPDWLIGNENFYEYEDIGGGEFRWRVDDGFLDCFQAEHVSRWIPLKTALCGCTSR